MRNRRKIRMLREKKKQLSRFLPLPFRASYPLIDGARFSQLVPVLGYSQR
jgi:hypothetical protein